MTIFVKIYKKYKKEKEQLYKTSKKNDLNREGYGYIKRRVGLLSNELKTPTYCSLSK